MLHCYSLIILYFIYKQSDREYMWILMLVTIYTQYIVLNIFFNLDNSILDNKYNFKYLLQYPWLSILSKYYYIFFVI